MSICDSVKIVDSKLVTEALTSVSRFSLIGDCTCADRFEGHSDDDSFEDYEYECKQNPMSNDQLEDLFRGLEKKMETIEEVKLRYMNLEDLNQDRLVNCFVKKIKNLTLCDGCQFSCLDLFIY